MVDYPYVEGDIIKGIITSIKKYGAFLSFENGYIGLLHISEISTNFVNNIHSFFSIGDEITVAVKRVDRATKFLNVSIKDLPIPLVPPVINIRIISHPESIIANNK